jgi:type IV pilus assembly protein PilW
MKKLSRTLTLAVPSRKRLRGLSLIELMVALVLGVIIVAALSQLFVGISRTNQEMAKTNSQIENARFALQFLRDDIAHAGFWGGYVPPFDDLSLIDDPGDEDEAGGTPVDFPDTCKPYDDGTALDWNDPADPDYDSYRNQLLGVAIQVTGGPPPISSVDSTSNCGGIVVDQVDDTIGPGASPGTSDVLVVRHAETCEPDVGNCDDDGTVDGRLYFQVSFCSEDPEPYLLEPFPLANPTNNMLGRACTAGVYAPRRLFKQSIYYIRSWANETTDGIPTLVRSQFDLDLTVSPPAPPLEHQPAVELVEGIERFRVEVGIDDVSEPFVGTHPGSPGGRALVGFPVAPATTPSDLQVATDWDDEDLWETPKNRGDGIPDGNFVHCPTAGCTPFQLLNVVAVKVYVLARANEPSQGYTDTKTYTLGSSGDIGPFNDGFKRHVFSTTIRLNNISGRRETP